MIHFFISAYVFKQFSLCFDVLGSGVSSRLVRLDLGAGTGLLAALACKAQLRFFLALPRSSAGCMGARPSRLINLKSQEYKGLRDPMFLDLHEITEITHVFVYLL